MVLNYECQSVKAFEQVTNCIEQFKEYIEIQKDLIDKDLRLVIWTRPSTSSCSVILYTPFKATLKINPQFLLKNILKQVGIEEKLLIEEITLNHLTDYHSIPDSIFYIDSLDEIASNEVEKFTSKSMHEPIQEAETFINDEYLDLLNEELLRIKGYPKDHFTGNPCHYLFTSNSSDAIDASNYLVYSLAQSNRLHSTKIREIEFGFGLFFQQFKYKFTDTISHCLGHVIRIIFTDEFSKESHQTKHNAFTRVVKMIEEYGNTVLFIFHFNELLYEESRTFLKKDVANLYIEFSKSDLNVEEAKQYIIEEAFKYGLEPSEVIDELISNSENKTYSKTEIRNQLIVSSKRRLYQSQFEPYLDLMNKKLESFEKETLDLNKSKSQSALKQLDQLIGLEKVKKLIKNMVTMNKLKPSLYEKGITIGQPSMHCCFMGHPGTAKTTVARLLAQIMKEEGILKTGVFVEVTRKDLIGQYVGQTAPRVKDVFNKAKGGVLFIDEAYALHDGYGHKSFGDEAIATLVELMENHRHNTIVIMAGYPKEMNDFLEINPGLKSRIPNMINFNNYSISEMMQIAKHLTSSKGFEFDEESLYLLERNIQNARQLPSFANGRTIRNLVEDIIQKHIIHLYQEKTEPTKEQLLMINSKSVELIELNYDSQRHYRKIQYN